ncbi:hypothetical protein DTL21_12250 [Bremerella cremea]|uniref:DUF1963 domain-containing protein n=1 Tax=Blastopirellula marina TaxID=124 RepID=A0A2S8FQ73_9BACT|nr:MULTISPECIES: hypothetical protein [Pirellulaceae]PQO34297.1 hypothetical protein C5Y83_12245 [Blastopirellula marina]RCS46793.1 hypothetical protein DTL21_12250 [Bremerella cremea]
MTTGIHSPFLFGNQKIAGVEHHPGKFSHQFGGGSTFQGTSREDCDGLHVHLIYLFDLNDPKIPIEVPGIRWLPLFYCFDFQVVTIGYQLLDDQHLKFFFNRSDARTSDHEEWPGDDFPMQFVQSEVTVHDRRYDPQNVEDAYRFSGIFGVDELSTYDLELLKERVVQENEDLLDAPLENDEDFRDHLHMPFLNGIPEARCMNPVCDLAQQSRKGQLKPLALLSGNPAKGVHLFGEFGDYTSLYFQRCEMCQTIRVDVC